MPAYLTGAKRLPHTLPQTIGNGDQSEAIAYAAGHINTWRRSAGAIEWLKAQAQAKGTKTKKRAQRKGRRVK